MMNMIIMPTGSNYTEIAGISDEANGRCPNWTIRSTLAAGHWAREIVGEFGQQGRPIIDIERLEAQLPTAS